MNLFPMKSSLLFGSALLALGMVSAFGAEPLNPKLPAALAPSQTPIEKELQPLMAKIKAKLDAGAQSEDALSDELKAFDALIAEHRGEQSEGVADALYAEATLYQKVILNYDKAAALLTKVKNDYPRTQAAFAASAMLDQYELEKDRIAIQTRLKPGAKFPDFSETDINGAPISISKYHGKVVLVDFWATWCQPCVEELPNVLAAYAKYHDKGFEIVGISLDQNEDQMKRFIADKKITWQQYFDGKGFDSKLGQKYGVSAIPATYLIDGDGKIVARNLRGPALGHTLDRLLK